MYVHRYVCARACIRIITSQGKQSALFSFLQNEKIINKKGVCQASKNLAFRTIKDIHQMNRYKSERRGCVHTQLFTSMTVTVLARAYTRTNTRTNTHTNSLITCIVFLNMRPPSELPGSAR